MKKNYVVVFSMILFVGGTFFAGCSSDTQKQKTTLALSAGEPVKTSSISFKVNGQLVNTSGWNISRFAWENGGREWLNITTNMHEDKRTIMTNLNGAIAGTYTLGTGSAMKSSHGDYKPDYAGDMMHSYSFISGAFVLTEVDTVHNKISGTFSGKVKDNKGEVLEISEGKIVNAPLRPGVTRY